MITLYSPFETNFTHDGLGILDEAISCIVTRDIGNNVVWDLELEFPLYSKKADRITELCILKVPTPSGLQLFRIVEVEKNLETINVIGQHIFFDLAKNYITSINEKDVTREQAIKRILNNTISPHNFKYVDGDNNNVRNDISFDSRNVLDCIMGNDNSVFSIWGSGQLIIDNFNISSRDAIGENRSILIAFGKNMTGITTYTDMSGIVTRIIPVSGDGLMLPEVYIDSKYINNYHQPFISKVVFNDIKVVEKTDDTEEVTKEQVYELLRAEAKKMFDTGIDIPVVSYEVSFIDLSNTKKYEKFKGIHKLDIGDIIRVENELFGIDLDMKIRNYSYNSLTKEFQNLKIGTEVAMLSNDIKNLQRLRSNINEVNEILNQKIQETESNLSNRVTEINNRVNITNQDVAGVKQDVTGVKQDVTIVNQEVVTVRNELKAEIDRKVEEVDVKNIISNARTEVRTALNSNVVNYRENEINVAHNVGNTTLGANGIVYSDGNITSNYLFLKHTEVFQTVDDNEFEITLPNEFKGRNFTAFVSLSDTLERTDDWILNRVNLLVNRIDINDGKVFIVGYKTEMDKVDFNITRVQPIKGQLLVIA